MKACTVCNENKALDEFDKYRNNKGEQVATPRCKACRRAYIREYSRKKASSTGLTREEWLNNIRKPKTSPAERKKLGKDKWNAWYAEWKDSGAVQSMKEENRKKAEQERKAMLASGVKVCSVCEEELPLSQFHMRNRKRKDGTTYQSPYASCKPCRRAIQRVEELTPKSKARRKRKRALRDRRNKQATPKWLTEEHKQQIADTYEHMRDCRTVTGEDYHVDHIVPLRGDNICGLHVPWNLQVLPAYVNISKSNSHEE